MFDLNNTAFTSTPKRELLWAIQQAVVNWSVVLAGLLLYSGLSALTLVFVARQVSPVEYGQYVASFALASFLAVLPGLGMDTWLLTQHRATPKSAAVLWLSALRVRGTLLLIWLGFMGILSFFLPGETYLPQIWLPTVIGVALDSLTFLSYANLRSRNRHKIVALLQAISSSVLFGIALLLPASEHFVTIFAISRMLLSLLVATVVLAILGMRQKDEPQALLHSNQIFASSRPFLISDIASAVSSRGDLIIISLALGALGTAVYSPAITLLEASFLAPRAVFLFIMPILSKSYVTKRHTFASRSILQLIAQALIGLGASIVTFFFASELVGFFFKSGYESSADILRLFSPIPFLRSINYALGTILGASNRQPSHTRVQVMVAGFNIITNLIIITPFGLVGVSIVYIASDILLLIGSAFAILQKQSRQPETGQASH